MTPQTKPKGRLPRGTLTQVGDSIVGLRVVDIVVCT